MNKVKQIPGACPECGRGQLVSFTRDEDFDFDLGDERVAVQARNVPVEKCDTCGEIMSGPAAARVRHDAICRAVGLLTPSEIKAIREKFGWSQQHLAALTDFGIATVSRWERGRLLQNRSANKVLLGLRDCPAFRAYLESLVEPKGSLPSPQAEEPINRLKGRYVDKERVPSVVAFAAVFEFSRN
ncbi:MAG: type II toxin-antitoxin system MqsA family antitoxin [Planctomycetes bacterium]|jgi:putative zinc finger/helix-turn-helix YgiT family protein|nr:type II toxin-antitoxin system MqsA family antitoxin [Planctomycetota bacterium]